MTETFVDTMNLPGAVVPVDPRLEALLAINLLDEEPDQRSKDMVPRPFRETAASASARIPVLAR